MKTSGTFFIILTISLYFTTTVSSQVLISDSTGIPDSSAMLEIRSTNKGLLLPRIDYNNRPANPQAGTIIFVTANGPHGNNTIYMYNGASWITFFTPYIYIGQTGFGGKVFYVDSTGQHGYAVTDINLNTDYTIPWGCFGTLIGPAAQGTAMGTGQANTAAIVAACNPNPNVAHLCDTLTLNGYSDWFLPSHDELDSVNVHSSALGIIPDWYWSSSEHDADAAYLNIFGDPPGNWTWASKAYGLLIRCVRQF